MKKFIIGLVVGAAAVYAASKIIDEETKEELRDKLDRFKDDAEYRYRKGKRKAMRAGIKAKHDIIAGKERAAKAAGDFVGRVSDDLEILEEKLKDKTGKGI